VRRALATGPVPVIARVPQDAGPPAWGQLSYINNVIDDQTGTIMMKASFANDDGALWPGAYVNVTVTLGIDGNALVIPSEGVQTGQNGQYVFVVKPDHTVEMRPVKLARTVGGESVIASGLTAGETVVTQGQLRLAPGVKVIDKARSAPQASASLGEG